MPVSSACNRVCTINWRLTIDSNVSSRPKASWLKLNKDPALIGIAHWSAKSSRMRSRHELLLGAGASRWMPRCASRATPDQVRGRLRAGLERLLRYCARPPFALERLEQLPDGQIVYRFPKPQPDGTAQVRLTPLELIDRLATLIPPPRLHRHRYHGVVIKVAPRS